MPIFTFCFISEFLKFLPVVSNDWRFVQCFRYVYRSIRTILCLQTKFFSSIDSFVFACQLRWRARSRWTRRCLPDVEGCRRRTLRCSFCCLQSLHVVYRQLLLLPGCMERVEWFAPQNAPTQNMVPFHLHVFVALECPPSHLARRNRKGWLRGAPESWTGLITGVRSSTTGATNFYRVMQACIQDERASFFGNDHRCVQHDNSIASLW